MAEKYLLSSESVRKLAKLFRSQGSVSPSGAARSVAALDAEVPPTYEVRFAASANDGAGAWMIWLGGAVILRVNGTQVPFQTVRNSMPYVGGAYPSAGWVSLQDVLPTSGGTLWMRVLVPTTDSGSISVEWATEAGTASEGYVLKAIPIAVANRSSSTGQAKVWQLVTGLVDIDAITAVKVVSGANSNVVGTGEIDSKGVLTLTLDVYYK